MFEVNFSEQSMSVLNKLDAFQQMGIVERISLLTEEDLKPNNDSGVGTFVRKHKTYHRVRAKEYRIYFEHKDDQLWVEYILNKNSLTDFIFRCKLPITEEQMIEQHESFWRYLESLKNDPGNRSE
jgi:mRNA-degrading endonuclease RelE of RelBE toxin-antitoxin system